ncbi:MAG: hypothetical protein JWO03_803 [Bacteroidetes bacterium]|nr:hypothetical protein [Bacteroidota bacterium]
MKIFKALFILIPIIVAALVMNSCHKEQFSTKGALSFSTDTLTFDTVFTTLGSTTKYFKVRNTQSKSLNVSSIKLMQLEGTQFRINVDGISGTEFKNVDIPAHDSIYVFVEVTINPNSANNPFVIFDQVQFVTNGVTQNVVLEAMGQNAYYHFSEHITNATPPWQSDKPHIIVNRNGGLPILAIDTGVTFNIPAKCQIYMGPNAVITVDGTLNAHGGDWGDSIVFQYIRHDYQNKPGQWLGITYSRIGKIDMDHVVIDQSTFGISDEYVLDLIAKSQITTSDLRNYGSDPNIPKVTLDKCIIRNCSSSALTAIRTKLVATNCLMHTSGGNMIVCAAGGTYDITNCTFANIYNQYTSHQNPSLLISEQIAYIDNQFVLGPYPTVANIFNTAITGNLNNEVAVVSPSNAVTASFQYCNLSMDKDTFHVIQSADNGCKFNFNPSAYTFFVDVQSNNYMPDSTISPLTDSGSAALQPNPSVDLFDQPRSTSPSPNNGTPPFHSIGAIEWHQ